MAQRTRSFVDMRGTVTATTGIGNMPALNRAHRMEEARADFDGPGWATRAGGTGRRPPRWWRPIACFRPERLL